MVVNRRTLKRAMGRVTADLCDFLTFPAAGDGITDGLDGPFRVSVREFLVRHARLPPPSSILSPSAVASPHVIPWRITFRVGDLEDAVVELNIVEEDVLPSKSIYCDHCRIVGWSGHPVCGKRYHFIIRNDSKSSSGCRQTCIHCGNLLPLSDTRCVACKYEMGGEDLEDWPYVRLEDSTHWLHGVVHANGYGHLLRVNGREGGSKYLTGCDIMGFWDRICKMLHVRYEADGFVRKAWRLVEVLWLQPGFCLWVGLMQFDSPILPIRGLKRSYADYIVVNKTKG